MHSIKAMPQATPATARQRRPRATTAAVPAIDLRELQYHGKRTNAALALLWIGGQRRIERTARNAAVIFDVSVSLIGQVRNSHTDADAEGASANAGTNGTGNSNGASNRRTFVDMLERICRRATPVEMSAGSRRRRHRNPNPDPHRDRLPPEGGAPFRHLKEVKGGTYE
jgi:hypothetical protein